MVVRLTIPAVRRVDLLRQTVGSFWDGMFAKALLDGFGFIPHVNVDPVGPDSSSVDVIAYLRERFFILHYRTPEIAGFGSAVHWLWNSCTECDYVLHLEDDWKLLTDIDLKKMADLLEAHPKLASLRLSMWPSDSEKILVGDSIPFRWNGKYFACPSEHKAHHAVSGHPTLFKYKFIKSAASMLDPNLNPEKQFWFGNPRLAKFIQYWDYGIYSWTNHKPVIADIGRTWRQTHGYAKDQPADLSPHFLKWRKVS